MIRNIFKTIALLSCVSVSGIVSAQCPTIACPGNITVNKAPTLCGAIVNYTTPVGADPCMTIQTTLPFSYTGSVQTWTVPAGVNSITVDARGGSGGQSWNTSGLLPNHIPGIGGRVVATVAVTPGQVLNIYVAGKGANGASGAGGAGGWNGGGTAAGNSSYAGGGGGGATDIRIGGTALSNRVLVAAGGGGAAYNYGAGDNGGNGGGLTGANGMSNNGYNASYCGLGGTQTAGGNGGNGATAGALGVGGNGASGTNTGGGGGGGYYGGGGSQWAGGAGGSSWTNSSVCSNVTNTAGGGSQNSNGSLSITYTPGPTTTQTSGLPSGSLFPIGVTTNTFLVAGGNSFTATCSFTVTVVGPAQPVITTQPVSSLTLCAGNTINLSAVVTGGSYYQWRKDGVPLSNGGDISGATTTNLQIQNAVPGSTGSYTLEVGHATGCNPVISDPAVVQVDESPSSTLNGQTYQVCEGNAFYLPVTLTGLAPYSLTYTDGTNTFTQNNIGVDNYQMPVTVPLGTSTFQIIALSHSNGCSAVGSYMTGTNTTSAYSRPTASLSGNPTICNGSFGNVQVNFSGAAPYSFTYGDGGSFTYTVSNIMTNPYTLTVTPGTTTSYNITAVNDQNCASFPQDISGTSLVTVNNRPTGNLSGSAQTVCHGNPVTLTANFTGTPPFSMLYTNGSGSTLISPINTNSYTFSATPQTSGAYTISALTDASCVSMSSDLTGNTPVTVNHPAAALSGSQISCTGGTANLLVDFSGNGATAPYTFTYTDGQQTNTVTTTSDPYSLTVNTTGSTTFVLTSFNDANCLGDISGSASIVANPNGGWNGNISSDWQNPANWCGGVPSNTTDVTIPAIAPNMPVLSTGNGFTHHLTVEPGATMSVTNGANYFLYGDLNNDGSLLWTTGNVSMNGTVPQTVDGFTCQNLFINNMDGVTPTQDINVNAILQLNGNVYLNNTDLLMTSTASQIIGQEATQYVHTMGTGTLKRSVTTTPTLFPVGRDRYNPVTLTNNGVPDEYSVRVFDAVYADGDGSTSTATVTFPVVGHTWMISEKQSGGSSVTVEPQWNNLPGEELNFFDRAHVFVRHWDGTSWSFVDSVGALACTGYGTFGPYSASQSGYNTFSPFTVGGWNLWPLAIELIDFTAQLQDNDNALVSWNISQSSDAKGFDVEYSTDGTNFSKVGEVSAVANKTNYSMMHRGLAEGRNYYRLKVMDIAGNSAYSKIAVVTTKGLGVDIISLSPNPVTGVGTLSVSSDEATVAEVRVMDAVGRVLSSGKYDLSQGNNNVVVDMNNLPQGNYTLHVITNTGNATPVKFTKL
jgi:hypothetical protein